MREGLDGRGAPAHARAGRARPLLVLWAAQALLAFLVLREFITGERYFAYLDIGADTYEIFTSHAMHLARLVAREGWSSWSFGIGLGAPTTLMAFSDPFRWLTVVAGPEGVLPLRIWVYLGKLVLGGTFFFLLARDLVVRSEAALLAAIGYSFCGYIAINGQWDPEANPFVFFPLVLWALVRLLRGRGLLAFPLAVAAALASGIFIGMLAVSLAVTFAACLALADEPRRMLREWLLKVAPLAALGCVIAAPFALPLTLMFLDSPRVAGGAGSVTARVWAEALGVFDVPMLMVQLASLFHKDLFGTGSMYRGHFNYLEGPEFYVGLLPLLLAPQLWGREPQGRRALLVGVIGIAVYMAVPFFRLAAFGFAALYFRATSLWVTLALLLLGALALDRVLREGLEPRRLAAGVLGTAALFGLTLWSVQGWVWAPHVWKVAVFLVLWAVLLGAAAWRRWPAARLQVALALLVCVEAIAFAWPSLLGARPTAAPDVQPFDDVTAPALAAIRALDGGFHRVEKTYASVSESEAVAQDYFGVKSYYYHGRNVIRFHQSMAMMRRFGFTPPSNFTNWVASPGDRYVVHSALGVKYVISKKPLDWPGFSQAAAGPGWYVFRNELALPLGVVHTRQVSTAEVKALSRMPPDREQWFRDLALVNAVVLDEPMPAWGTRWDLPERAASGRIDLAESYARPAQALQESGLEIGEFRHDRIRGRIRPAERGILVFSIPAYPGWSLQVDGRPAPLITANFGLLASPVEAGVHEIELVYRMPGLRAGILLGLAGCLLLAGLLVRARRR